MESKYKVLLTHPLPEEWMGILDEKVELITGPNEMMGVSPIIQRHLPEMEGFITFLCDKVTPEILGQAPKLKVLCNYAAGTDNVDINYCTGHGIPVGCTPGVLTDATADLTIGLILAVNRQIIPASEDARNGKWKMWYPDRWMGFGLSGTTLGIVGMGRIGSAVAKRASAFGMKIIYTSRTEKPDLESEINARRVHFDELLAKSDIVSLHAPSIKETIGLFNKYAFQHMRNTAIFINTSRGNEVDTQALVYALKEGWIAGAGLDVTNPEPLPPSHPLYQLKNCIILPHIGSATVQARQQMAEMTCLNLLAGLAGEKIPFCANPDVYKI